MILNAFLAYCSSLVAQYDSACLNAIWLSRFDLDQVITMLP